MEETDAQPVEAAQTEMGLMSRRKIRRLRTVVQDTHGKTDTFLAFYMFDVTVVNDKLAQENHDQKLVAGLIYIDNYDEIFESLEEVRHSLLVALVDRKINKYMAMLTP